MIVPHVKNVLRIKLVKEKVERFSIHKHNFELLDPEGNGVHVFYEVLYRDVHTGAFIKWIKIIENEHSGNVISKFFVIKEFFFEKNGTYYPINSKLSALKIFSDYKTELS